MGAASSPNVRAGGRFHRRGRDPNRRSTIFRRALLAIHDSDGRCEDARAIAEKHLADIRAQIRKTAAAEQMLAAALSRCPGGTARDCTVLTLLQTGDR